MERRKKGHYWYVFLFAFLIFAAGYLIHHTTGSPLSHVEVRTPYKAIQELQKVVDLTTTILVNRNDDVVVVLDNMTAQNNDVKVVVSEKEANVNREGDTEVVIGQGNRTQGHKPQGTGAYNATNLRYRRAFEARVAQIHMAPREQDLPPLTDTRAATSRAQEFNTPSNVTPAGNSLRAIIAYRNAPGTSDFDGRVYGKLKFATLTPEQYRQLQQDTSGTYEFVTPDVNISASIDQTDSIIQGPLTRQQSGASGVTGICVLDSGIDYTLDQFADNYVGGYDFVNNDTDPMDDNGHGTGMADAITTIAPGAQLYAAKVLDVNGSGHISDVIQGIDWCMQQNVTIISLSLGGGSYASWCDSDLLAQKANEAAARGFFVSAAAGNLGSDSMTTPACGSLVTSVAATYKNDTFWPGASLNSVTDVLAPGVGVYILGDSSLNHTREISTGSSISAAVVSGGAAVVMESTGIPASTVQERIRSTGVLLNNGSMDFPRIDLYKAYTNTTNGLNLTQDGYQSSPQEVNKIQAALGDCCAFGDPNNCFQCTSPATCCSSNCRWDSTSTVCSTSTSCTSACELDTASTHCDFGTCDGTVSHASTYPSSGQYCSGGSIVGGNCAAGSCSDSGTSNGGGTCTETVYNCNGAGSCNSGNTNYNDVCSGTTTVSVTYYYCSGASCASGSNSGSDSCGAVGSGCSATDYYCSGTTMTSSSTSGSDSCSDAGAGGVTYDDYYCSGSSCVDSSGTVYDSCSDTGTSSGGGSCSATNYYCSGSSLASSGSSGTDTCGGTAANPSVTYYACSGGNTCTSAVTNQADSCSDSGTANGGGTCSAHNWACAGTPGTLSDSASSGTDTCGGTADSPSVTYYACSGGNTCTSASTAPGTDSCSKVGTSCSATNYACAGSPGTLSTTPSSGTDTCNTVCTVTTYSCTTADGATADTCTSSGVTNTAANKVCSGGTAVDAGAGTACDASVDYYASEDACTYEQRYAECNGAGSCDTTSATYYQGTTLNVPAGSVSNAQSGGSSLPYSAVSCSNYCGTSGSAYCSGENYLADRQACGGAGACNGGTTACTTAAVTGNGAACSCDGQCTSGLCNDNVFDGAVTAQRCKADASYCVDNGGTVQASGATVGDSTCFGSASGGSVWLAASGRFIVKGSSGTVFGVVDKYGSFGVRGTAAYSQGAFDSGWQVKNNVGTTVMSINSANGNLKAASTLSARGVPSCTGFQIKNSGGTLVACITSAGAIQLRGDLAYSLSTLS